MSFSEPGCCSIALKEWAGVCAALSEGRQSILLRKGGIRELAGPGMFAPDHDAFWLYPTAVHQAEQGLRDARGTLPAGQSGADSRVPISLLARVVLVAKVRDEAMLPGLEPFHVFTAETVSGRFRYRAPGLWVLAARIYRRDVPAVIEPTSEQAGCHSWVTLDPPLSRAGLLPVVDEPEWVARLSRLRDVLGDSLASVADPRRAAARPDAT